MSVQDDRYFTHEFSVDEIYSAINKSKNNPTSSTINEDKLVKKRIVLFSDSHGRDLRHLIQQRFQGRGEVYSEVKSNATFENVISGLDREVKPLGRNDHLLVCAGTNNIDSINKFDVNSCVTQIARIAKDTYVILCTTPLRYDSSNLNGRIRISTQV